MVAAYEGWDFAKVTRIAMALADRANEYVDRAQPWALAKTPGKESEVQAACSVALNLFRQIVIYLAPVLPKLAEDSAALLGLPLDRFELAKRPLVGSQVGAYQHLMKRVEPEKVQKMIDESKPATISPDPSERGPDPARSDAAAPLAEDGGDALEKEPLVPTCTIDDFTKVDLRVARIVAAEPGPRCCGTT